VGTVAWVTTSDSGDGRSSGPWYASEPSTTEFPAIGSSPDPGGPGRLGGLGTLGGPARHGRPGKSHKLLYILIAAGVAVVAAIAAVVVVVTGGKGHTTGFQPSGDSAAQDVEQITTAFLQAWQSGDLSQAANYTDNPAAARAALTSYHQTLGLKKLSGSVQDSTASATSTTQATVQYSLTTTVSAADGAKTLSGAWSYHSALTAYQKKNSSLWYISWKPDVLAPNLTAATHVAAVIAPPEVGGVNDSSGNDVTSYKDAGLSTIANLLEKKAPPGRGSNGLYVEIQSAKGQVVPNSAAVIIPPANIPYLATTIDPTAEKAARSAVAMHANSSMVAIQPSTGKILAIANNAGFNDFALTAKVAPGSTMKIITSTALISKGVLTASTGVACPAAFTIQGITYHNDNGESEPPGTPFVTDFAQSCNNAFTTQWSHLTGGGLAGAAKNYFGLDQAWNIGITGVSGSYFNAPASASGSELAQEAFGEGALTASPLAMASVAATIDYGSFKSPIMVPGTKQLSATPLSSSTDAQLKEMMQAVVTSGTAAAIGFGSGIYAKTGTADIQGQEQPNSWLVAFDPSKDIAVACLVVNAGYGAQYAGPEAKSFLDGY
jgi:Penicillin binding protein transpeptidase domain/NTF2-like N-terminal transpeptidase domain